MNEPHAPGQVAYGAPIPSQAPMPGVPLGAASGRPARNRSSMIVVLVLVGVLVLCGGIAGTAIYVSNNQFSEGASSPEAAVNIYLTGVYLHQEASDAEDVLCQQADPTTLVTEKIRDAQDATTKYDAVYSWSPYDVTGQDTATATVTTELTAATDLTDPAHSYRKTTALTIQTINSDGWWVCDVQSSPN